ncbi:MAG: hypothetical protein HZA93_29580 [Verrucomicrobia bacterium]|nr:hypothetical protein [Verrucomicrobiota bacterium]
MSSHGKWTSTAMYFYYITGSIYYAYKWFVILGVSGFFFSGALLYFLRQAFVFPVLVAVLSVLAILIGVAFWRKTVSLRVHSQNPNIRIRKMEIEYTIVDKTNCDYARTVEFVAVAPVDHYSARFNWTGDGNVESHVLSGADSAVVEEHPRSPERVCVVRFGQMINAGCSHKFSYRLRCLNATKPVKPFLGFDADTYVEELVQCVHFAESPPQRFKRQILAARLSEVTLREWVDDIDGNWKKEAKWTAIKAFPRNYYRIAWEWPKANSG